MSHIPKHIAIFKIIHHAIRNLWFCFYKNISFLGTTISLELRDTTGCKLDSLWDSYEGNVRLYWMAAAGVRYKGGWGWLISLAGSSGKPGQEIVSSYRACRSVLHPVSDQLVHCRVRPNSDDINLQHKTKYFTEGMFEHHQCRPDSILKRVCISVSAGSYQNRQEADGW